MPNKRKTYNRFAVGSYVNAKKEAGIQKAKENRELQAEQQKIRRLKKKVIRMNYTVRLIDII